MTMTGRTVPMQIREEYEPDSGSIAWGHEYGALDASPLIPAGSTKAQCVGRHGFGMPQCISRERQSWTMTVG